TLWIASKWGASPPADPIARSHLKTDIGLSEQSARSFLAIYKENVAFAGFKPSDKVADPAVEMLVNALRPTSRPTFTLERQEVEQGQVKLVSGERIAFTEEGQPGQYLKLIASG